MKAPLVTHINPDRRNILRAMLATGSFYMLPQIARSQTMTQTSPHEDATPFSFEMLRKRAQKLSRSAYSPAKIPHESVLEKIDYNYHNQVKFRMEETLWLNQGGVSPVQPFFPGRYFKEPVHLYKLESGMAQEVPFSLDLFDIPPGNPARKLTDTEGFAGFRVRDAYEDRDWMAFLGASYWRTSGYSGQFGLSVRGLALDTALPNGLEEFPRFTHFWLEPAENGDLTVYALLDGPSATGAYRIKSRHDNGVMQDVTATIYMRDAVQRLGIAPLTSMFWYGKSNSFVASDWRPEVHDSDGLEIHGSNGERIWRPLNNPPRTMVNTFTSPDVRGFGLMQRERDFAQYQDDAVFYEKRASAWVEPTEEWGEGAVNLVELRTDDEIHDNIVAFWEPSKPAKAGDVYNMSYRLSWLEDCPMPQTAARFIATRIGAGGNPGEPRPKNVVKIVSDLDGYGLTGLGREDEVAFQISTSHGTLSKQVVYPVVGKDYWRAVFDLDFSQMPAADDTPIDIRAHISHGGEIKSETLLLQFFPSQLRRYLGNSA